VVIGADVTFGSSLLVIIPISNSVNNFLASEECPTSSKAEVASCPPLSSNTSIPPGCSCENFVTSYTLL